MNAIQARFWANVDKESAGECWLWGGPINRKGYGVFTVGKNRTPAHRVAYEMEVGPIEVDPKYWTTKWSG